MVQTSEILAYVDDLAVIICGNSRRELEDKMNTVLKELHCWCKENELEVAKTRTKYMFVYGTMQTGSTIKMDNNKIGRYRALITWA